MLLKGDIVVLFQRRLCAMCPSCSNLVKKLFTNTLQLQIKLSKLRIKSDK